MARQLRLEHPGAVWHITSRGNERKDIFRDDNDRETLLGLLTEAVTVFGWKLHAYVLMTDHFHLLLETPECTLSKGMHWFNGCYVQRFNKKHQRVRHHSGNGVRAVGSALRNRVLAKVRGVSYRSLMTFENVTHISFAGLFVVPAGNNVSTGVTFDLGRQQI